MTKVKSNVEPKHFISDVPMKLSGKGDDNLVQHKDSKIIYCSKFH